MTDKYAALKQAAQIVAVGDWLYHDRQKLDHVGGGFLAIDGKESVFCLNSAVGGIKKGNDVVKYIAAANPATVLALLDELESKDRRNAELNSTLERWATDRAQSASELDDAEKRIAELEARELVVNLPAYVDGRTLGYGEVNHMIDLCADAIEKAGHAAGIITKVGE